MTTGAARRLADAAASFLAVADRDRACFPFDDERRRTWTYLPGERPGVPLADLGRAGTKAALELLGSALAIPAYAQATTIMGLEDVLDRLEDGRRGRHRGDYWVAVFGDPENEDEPWGWRVEGHHLSVNVTIAGGEVLGVTPLFLGSNPARVIDDGGAVVLAPLAREEDLAFALLAALAPAERSEVVVSDDAPSDIVTRDDSEVDPKLQPEGLLLAELSGDALDVARRLVATYVDRLTPDLAARHRPVVEADDVGGLRFVWAGGDRHGTPHYYRLQGPTFLAELDNTQNDANHVHSVWRDPTNDFGTDLLAEHYRGHPHHA